MNSYELSRKWFNYSFDNPEKIKPIHSAIYFFAIEHCNRLGWKDKFGFPSQMVMEAIGVKNWKTYSKGLKDLVDFGFIEMIEKSKNQYSSNIIAIVKNTKAHTKALDKALSKHSPKQVQSTVSINKQYNKEQINNKQEVEDDRFYNIDDLILLYKKNEKIIKAVLVNGKKNNINNREHLFKRLNDFNIHLASIGEQSKKFKDYCGHFLSWNRKQPKTNNPMQNIAY